MSKKTNKKENGTENNVTTEQKFMLLHEVD